MTVVPEGRQEGFGKLRTEHRRAVHLCLADPAYTTVHTWDGYSHHSSVTMCYCFQSYRRELYIIGLKNQHSTTNNDNWCLKQQKIIFPFLYTQFVFLISMDSLGMDSIYYFPYREEVQSFSKGIALVPIRF